MKQALDAWAQASLSARRHRVRPMRRVYRVASESRARRDDARSRKRRARLLPERTAASVTRAVKNAEPASTASALARAPSSAATRGRVCASSKTGSAFCQRDTRRARNAATRRQCTPERAFARATNASSEARGRLAGGEKKTRREALVGGRPRRRYDDRRCTRETPRPEPPRRRRSRGPRRADGRRRNARTRATRVASKRSRQFTRARADSPNRARAAGSPPRVRREHQVSTSTAVHAPGVARVLPERRGFDAPPRFRSRNARNPFPVGRAPFRDGISSASESSPHACAKRADPLAQIPRRATEIQVALPLPRLELHELRAV
jgi:hypothetical protein